MTHTPGPWKWRVVDTVDMHGKAMRSHDLDGSDDVVLSCMEYGGPESADANLIAAAPDLLAALGDLLVDAPTVRHMGTHELLVMGTDLAAAREAIAKATGTPLPSHKSIEP